MWEIIFPMEASRFTLAAHAAIVAQGVSLTSVTTGPTPGTVIIALRGPAAYTLIGIMSALTMTGEKP